MSHRTALIAVALLSSGCGYSPSEEQIAEEVVSAALAALAGGPWNPLLVRPVIGSGTDLFREVPPFESQAEGYVLSQRPDIPAGLFTIGRALGGVGFVADLGDGHGYVTMERTDDAVFRSPSNEVRASLRERYGERAMAVAFSRPAVSESGREALVYVGRDALRAMGQSTSYIFLRRGSEGWEVLWEEGWYEQ